MTLILFTTRAPDTLADELTGQGHDVYEALAVSEVLALTEEHREAQITTDVDSERAKAIQQHYSTLDLELDATFSDIIWELSQLSPSSFMTQ